MAAAWPPRVTTTAATASESCHAERLRRLAAALTLLSLSSLRAHRPIPPALRPALHRRLPRPQRTGAMGPALLPEPGAAAQARWAQKVIAEGRVATQMAGLSRPADRQRWIASARPQWIYTPVAPAGLGRSRHPRLARRRSAAAGPPANRRERRPDERVRRRRGRRPPRLDRRRRPLRGHAPLRQPLRAARRPKFTPDGRFVFFGSATAGSPSSTMEPRRRRRGASRAEHAQRRGQRRRSLGDGGELPAAHAGRCSTPT